MIFGLLLWVVWKRKTPDADAVRAGVFLLALVEFLTELFLLTEVL